ncbi:hypothetical protein EV714DRAFT_273098 [Schizophyllum commune]
MRFAILAAVFSALTGFVAAVVLEDRQLQACPPGRKTWCSGQECLDSGCEGCTDVGTDYAPGTANISAIMLGRIASAHVSDWWM